jgi:transcriptional regulator with XRE-family HTH domain
MDTKDLLLEHFLKWQTVEKDKKTLRQFADLIGISPQQLNHYWAGKRIPTLEIADLFYGVFGDERFFTVAGHDIPDYRLKFVNSHWNEFEEQDKNKMMELFAKYKTRPRKKRNATAHDIQTTPNT